MAALGFNGRQHFKRQYVRPAISVDVHQHQEIQTENLVIKTENLHINKHITAPKAPKAQEPAVEEIKDDEHKKQSRHEKNRPISITITNHPKPNSRCF